MTRRLVYVLASPRSGTTALEYILASHPRCHAVGEMRRLEEFVRNDDSLLVSKGRCTCGTELVKCAFWSDVLRITADKLDIPPESLCTRVKPRAVSERSKYGQHLRALMETIACKTNAVIIDSSKDADYLEVLVSALPDWDIRVIYMLREPLEVARSQNKWRQKFGMRPMPESYLVLNWLRQNFRNSRIIDRYSEDKVFCITYERFVTDTDNVLSELAGFLQLQKSFSTEINLRGLHTVAGTPSRFFSDHFVLSDTPHKNTAASASSWISRMLSLVALRVGMTPDVYRRSVMRDTSVTKDDSVC